MIDGGKLTPGKPVIVPRSPWCRRSTPASSKGKLTAGKAVIDLASAGASPRPCPCRRSTAGNSASWSSCRAVAGAAVVPTIDAGQFQGQADGGQAGHRPGSAGAFPRPCPCRRSTAGNSASWSSCRGHRPGNVPRSPWCRRSTPGKRAESGQAGHRPGKRRGLPAAVPVVPTIDAGQAWSSTWQCRGLPAAVPVLTIDGGQLGKVVIVPLLRAARGADDRRRPVPRASRRRASRSSTWQAPGPPPRPCRRSTAGNSASWSSCRGHRPGNVPPVVPMIDAGQFQGQADGGQAGHRPGKRRGLPRGRARADVPPVPVVPTIDAGKLVIGLTRAGASPAAVPAGCPGCRKSPLSPAGRGLGRNNAGRCCRPVVGPLPDGRAFAGGRIVRVFPGADLFLSAGRAHV